MVRQASGALLACLTALGLTAGCTSEQDRVAEALDRDLANALAGCVPIAWERNPELPVPRISCGTGRWQLNLPSILEVLSHTGRIRVAMETPGGRRSSRAKQYELVGGQPIATITTKADMTTVLCWADVRAHIVGSGPIEMRDGRLNMNVWFELETTPRYWAERLGRRDREVLRRNTYWTRYLKRPGEQSSWYRPHTVTRTATYTNGDWSFQDLTARRRVTWGTSERRIIWGTPTAATSRPRIARVDSQANRYRLFANSFEEGDLSAWKTTTP